MTPKYIVFDLDETLGYFTEMSIIWGCLQSIYKVKGQKSFDELCIVFEKHYFRPGIFSVLKYLKSKGDAVRVVLYTNNTGSMEWLKHIISYLERRSEAEGLFDKIIPGYNPKLKGPKHRVSFEKTYSEITRCADIPKNAKIVFFDDVHHPGMIHKNIKYIRVRPFCNPISSSAIISMLQKSYFGFMNFSSNIYLKDCIHTFHLQYAHHLVTTHVSTNDIMIPLKRFLREPKKTAKKRHSNSSRRKNSKTRKNN